MNPLPSPRIAGALTILACLACAGPAVAQDATARDAEGLARSLVELRSDVEQLTDSLEDAKRERRERRRALAGQKAQLEAELQREQLRVRQLREATDRKRDEIQRAQADDQALEPVVEAAVTALNDHIARALPFRKDERLAAVKQIQDRLGEGLLTPRSALNRLWALVEDELRMTRDTGLFRETLTLDGEEMIADVVRMGTVGLYVRTGDERVGTVSRVDGSWKTALLTGEQEREQVLGLFDAFKKQIRVGYFTLPNILPAPEAAQ